MVWREVRWFAAEAVIYAVLVGAYCYTAIRWAAAPLNRIFHTNRPLYAGLAISLILAQGFLLERLTTWLLRLLGRREDEKAR